MRVALVAALALASGCIEGVKPVDGHMASATIHGRVTTSQGDGVPGVSVVVEARAMGSCANAQMDRDSVVTDAAGSYRATVLNWGEDYTVCARVRIRPAPAFLPDSVDRAPVRLHYLDPDTIRADFVLRPSA